MRHRSKVLALAMLACLTAPAAPARAAFTTFVPKTSAYTAFPTTPMPQSNVPLTTGSLKYLPTGAVASDGTLTYQEGLPSPRIMVQAQSQVYYLVPYPTWEDYKIVWKEISWPHKGPGASDVVTRLETTAFSATLTDPITLASCTPTGLVALTAGNTGDVMDILCTTGTSSYEWLRTSWPVLGSGGALPTLTSAAAFPVMPVGICPVGDCNYRTRGIMAIGAQRPAGQPQIFQAAAPWNALSNYTWYPANYEHRGTAQQLAMPNRVPVRLMKANLPGGSLSFTANGVNYQTNGLMLLMANGQTEWYVDQVDIWFSGWVIVDYPFYAGDGNTLLPSPPPLTGGITWYNDGSPPLSAPWLKTLGLIATVASRPANNPTNVVSLTLDSRTGAVVWTAGAWFNKAVTYGDILYYQATDLVVDAPAVTKVWASRLFGGVVPEFDTYWEGASMISTADPDHYLTLLEGFGGAPSAYLYFHRLDNDRVVLPATRGDANGDFRSDVVLSNDPSLTYVPIATSHGDGNFDRSANPNPSLAALAAQSGVIAKGGDFNGDGRGDVLLTGHAGATTVPIGLANGDQTFTLVQSTNVGTLPALASTMGAKVVTGDFDGDKKTDIAIVNPGSSSLTVGYSHGDGSFSIGTYSTGLSGFLSLASNPSAQLVAGDFDNDGNCDIALVGGPGWTSIPIAYSHPNGYDFTTTDRTVANFPAYARDPGAKAVAGDFDGDGRSDIALTGATQSNGVPWYSIPVAFSNGDGSFRVTNAGMIGFPQWAEEGGAKPVAGDFDGDGRSDIALTGGYDAPFTPWNTIPIAFSCGDGTFIQTNDWVADFPGWAAGNGTTAPLVVGAGW